jgi:hypothetical protein
MAKPSGEHERTPLYGRCSVFAMFAYPNLGSSLEAEVDALNEASFA